MGNGTYPQYDDEINSKEIAALLGIHRGSVARLLEQHGIVPERRKGRLYYKRADIEPLVGRVQPKHKRRKAKPPQERTIADHRAALLRRAREKAKRNDK